MHGWEYCHTVEQVMGGSRFRNAGQYLRTIWGELFPDQTATSCGSGWRPMPWASRAFFMQFLPASGNTILNMIEGGPRAVG